MSKNSVSKSGDKYSYFLTSAKHDCFEVEKLHFCTWLFERGHECVEIGLQIKLGENFNMIQVDDSGKVRHLPLTVWIPWIVETKKEIVHALYKEISNKANAQFIFNDACPTCTSIDDWGDEFGQLLKFKHRGALGVLPFGVTTTNGRVDLDIRVPKVYKVKDSIYVRFVALASSCSPAFHLETATSDVYSYNVNVCQLRNAPDGFPMDELCLLKDVFCIHIVPSSYNQTFSDPNSFVNLRFLEVDHYKTYVTDQKFFKGNIKQDDHIVSFNKIKSPNKKASATNVYSFYSAFTKDCIGKKQVWYSIWINIACAVLVSVVSWACSWWIRGLHGQQGVEIQDSVVQSGPTNDCAKTN